MPPNTPEIVASLTQAQLEAKARSDRVIDELQLLSAQFAQRDFNRFYFHFAFNFSTPSIKLCNFINVERSSSASTNPFCSISIGTSMASIFD